MRSTRNRIALAVSIAALGALAVGPAVASAAETVFLRPPGKLTYCVYYKSAGKQTLRCDIKGLDDKALVLTDRTRVKSVTDSAFNKNARVIKQGQTIRKGDFVCIYTEPDFLCRNGKTGFGFEISGKKYEILKPSD